MGDFDGLIKPFYRDLEEELESKSLNFPTSFSLIQKTNEVLDNPNSSIRDFVNVIQGNPVVLAKIIRMANTVGSAGQGRKITSAFEAVQRLGLKYVRCLVYFISFEQIQSDCRSKEMKVIAQGIWKHTVDVGCWAYGIAKETALIANCDTAMLGGLMVDLGQFYIMSLLPKYPDIVLHADCVDELILKYHQRVTKQILDTFKLPQLVSDIYDENGISHKSVWPIHSLSDIVMLATLVTEVNNPYLKVVERVKRQTFMEDLDEGERAEVKDLTAAAKVHRDAMFRAICT